MAKVNTITTQEWGDVPDDYDWIDPHLTTTPCITIKTTGLFHLALYRVERTENADGSVTIERRLMTPEDLKL